MDPKATTTLDPKLKEAYDRVMGSSIPPTPQVPTIPQPPELKTDTAAAQPLPPMQPMQKSVVTPPENMHPAAPSPMVSSPSMTSMHATVTTPSGFVAHPENKKGGISWKLLVILAVVFLIIYTLFFVKFFGIPLPFLP